MRAYSSAPIRRAQRRWQRWLLPRVLLGLLFCVTPQAADAATSPPSTASEAARSAAGAEGLRQGRFGYEDYGRVLAAHVDERGSVDYERLKRDRAPLDRFMDRAARLDPGELAAWSRAEQVAFWVNVYNAFTLQVVLDHHPIRARGLRSLLYPNRSIRQIPGVWDRITRTVAGREVTLDGIEHDVLRTDFDEPRIHFALVCAARSCPWLRTEPYRGDQLDEQFADQVRRYLDYDWTLNDLGGSGE